MGKIHSWFLSCILILEIALCADVNVLMRPANSGTWERNGVYTMDVVLKNNTATPINLAGIELSFTYLSSLFKENGSVVIDNFSGNAANYVVNVLESKTNEVNCQKGIKSSANPNFIALPANGELVAYRIKFRVGAAATLGTTSFNFKGGTALAKRIAEGATDAVSITVANGSITVTTDGTKPITWANPTGTIINIANFPTGIVLNKTPSNEFDDLAKVFYTTDGTDPLLTSAFVIGKIPVIPTNDASTRGGASFVLKYMGQDAIGNTENVKQETYLVDVVPPEISSISVNTTYVKKGTQVVVSFIVSEELIGNPSVKIGSYTAALLRSNDLTREYTYSYSALGTETPGSKTIEISVIDKNNNPTTDTTKSIIFDFIKPVYTIHSLSPLAPKAEETLTIVISASELLNTTLSKVSIDGNKATLFSAAFPLYTFKYTVIGSEKTDLVFIEGVDLAGNASTNTDCWGKITATGKDTYENIGTSSSGVTINFIDRNKVKK